MEFFRRIFKYLLPQWPSIIVVIVSAVIVAILLSISFLTVIPILRVMLNEEGLHGWVDRTACRWRYGVEFSVPTSLDFLKEQDPYLGYCLVVMRVESKSPAEAAGLIIADRIIGVGELSISGQKPEFSYHRLLEELAAAKDEPVKLLVRRLGGDGTIQDRSVSLQTRPDETTARRLFGSTETRAKSAVIDAAQRAVGFLPREQGYATRTKATVFIIFAVGIITIIRSLAKFYQTYTAQKVVQVAINRIREDCFAHAMEMPMGFYGGERPSDTTSRIIRDTSVMAAAIKAMLSTALREPLDALFILAAAAWINMELTVIFLCGAPLTLWLLTVFGRKMKRATKKSLAAGAQMLGKLQEAMGGLKVVKVYNQQPYEREKFEAINDRFLKQSLKISKIDATTNPTMEVIGMVAGGAALVAGVHWVNVGRIDGPEFLGLLVLLGAAAAAVRKASGVWNKIQEANGAAERVFAIMDEPVESQKPNAVFLEPMRRRIEFRDVVFTYPGTETPVLKGVNLTVEAGQTIAIVGPNGSGKTTLINLLPRFYDPDTGQVLIDGNEIRDVTLFSLRNQIGMVTQNAVTFNDTVRANIAYGKRGARDEEIIAAAKRAFAHEFIEQLPDGYNTIIGEQGTGLSGGQLQRIVIARAILKNPAILIFDEATSQVDADSEAKIHRAIEEIMRGRTSFIIAHRFSTVVAADIIVVMDDGRIVAKGRHDELMQTCPLYQSLYQTQLVKA
jgi:ABC-type multidrug transport system fused ATPase/permease subunit